MQELDDMALLREYATRGSEEAFAALVTRHVNKVYSVALRHTRNPHQAEEITQAVFVILARKAMHLGKRVILEGWLYQTARLTAVTSMRGEFRRARREQEACMRTIANEDESKIWEQIAPQLDTAIGSLNETDRHAVVLRFIYDKSMKEVGTALGASESAATVRLHRALEKLRKFFAKHGVSSTGAIIAAAISANSVHAAPPALAKSVATVAFAKGTTASGSTLTLIKGALKLMAWSKAKIAIVSGAAVLLAAGTTTLVVNQVAVSNLMALSTNDLSWADDPKYWTLDFSDSDPQASIKGFGARQAAFDRRIKKLPPVLIIRPTKFQNNPGEIKSDGKIIGRIRSLSDLLRDAYDPGYECRVILPPDFPNEWFDLMLTLPDNAEIAQLKAKHRRELEEAVRMGVVGAVGEALKRQRAELAKLNPMAPLQVALKSRFGYTAHVETIETNVLFLKVKSSNAPALKTTKGGKPSYTTLNLQHKINIKNQPLGGVAACFGAQLNTMVIDRTEITNNYDIDLRWYVKAGENDEDAFKREVLEQLGLEFVPGGKPIKYLIVEKTE